MIGKSFSNCDKREFDALVRLSLDDDQSMCMYTGYKFIWRLLAKITTIEPFRNVNNLGFEWRDEKK